MTRALVTGASGALGACIARRLAREGLMVYVHGYRHPEHADAVRNAIRSAGGHAEVVVFDLCDGNAARSALEGILAQGPIHYLVTRDSGYLSGQIINLNGAMA